MISTPDFYGISQDTQMTAHSFRAAASHIRTLYTTHFSMHTGIWAIKWTSFLITSSSSTGGSTDPAQTTNHTQLLLSLIPFTLMLFCFYALWDDICCFREYPSRATLHLSALSPDKLTDSFLAGAQCLLPVLETWTLTPCPRYFWPPLNYFYSLL